MDACKILGEAPPTVRVDGADVPIRTSWRNGVGCMIAADDPTLSEKEKLQAILFIWFGRHDGGDRMILPPEVKRNLDEAAKAALSFFNLNEPEKPKWARQTAGARKTRTWDWTYDAWRTVADFQREYGIDLTDPETDMHWWRFWALFRGLGDTSATMTAVRIRGEKSEGWMSNDEKRALKRRKTAVALPARTREEALAITNLMWGLEA